ncbi:MAG: glycosyltransferase [Bacteroidaceae bacterium]|nr:glycosyltransferase [Bacteroidaceae bacterium]
MDSILAQSFEDWECILVDDGSPDTSGIICDRYAQSDDRFLVIHKENGGVSSARQHGLNIVKGTYVIHVDPDDWIEAGMIEALYSLAVNTQADVVMCDYYLDTPRGSLYTSQKPVSCKSADIMHQIFSWELIGVSWNKLIKRECIERYEAYFPNGIIIWEDVFFLSCILPHNVKVEYLPSAYYHYDRCINNNSIVSSNNDEKIESMKWLINYFGNDNALKGANLFYMKRYAKVCVFLNGGSAADVANLYAEINDRYLKEFRFSFFDPAKNAVKMILNGRSAGFTHLCYHINVFLLKVKHLLR